MYLPSIIIVGFYFDSRRALATGLAVCGSGVGMFIFAPLAEWLLARYGWRGANWVIAAIILNGIGCGALFRPLATTRRNTSTAPRDTLLERIRKERERRRTLSTGSLDGTLITRDNVFIKDRLLIRSILAPWENGRRTPSLYEHKTNPINIPARRHSTKTVAACSNSPSKVQCSASLHNPGGSSLLHQPITVLGSGHCSNASVAHTGTSTTNFHTQLTCQPLTENEQCHDDSNSDAVASPLIQSQSRTASGSSAMQRASHRRVIAKGDAARPLYRQDIFYSGSVTSIPEYRSTADMTSYVQSYTNMPTPGGERGVLAECCLPLSSVLVRMLDVTLLRSFTFLTLCIAGVFAMTGRLYLASFDCQTDDCVVSFRLTEECLC